MTANQINYAKHLEGVRHSIAEEVETNRANQAREAETNRSNRQFELIGVMNAQAAQANASAALANARTNEYNAQTRHDEQWQTQLYNQRMVEVARSQLRETTRHNQAMEESSSRTSWANAWNAASKAADTIARYLI